MKALLPSLQHPEIHFYSGTCHPTKELSVGEEGSPQDKTVSSERQDGLHLLCSQCPARSGAQWSPLGQGVSQCYGGATGSATDR